MQTVDDPARGRPYAVMVGDANLDIAGIPFGPLHPPTPGPGRIHFKPGGVARNSAECLARLGADCRLLSVFGDDAHGRELIEHTRRAGVDVSASRRMTGMSSSCYLAVHGIDGEPALAVADVALLNSLTPDVLAQHRPLLRDAALIATTSSLPPESLAWLCGQSGQRTLFVDTVWSHRADNIRPWLAHVHTLKPNRREACQLSGLPFTSREHAPAIADWFHDAGVRQVVLSLGAYGLYYSNGQHAGWMDALPVDVVNANGAGDALMAGLAFGWLERMPFVETVRFALGCAALTLGCQENCHPGLAREAVDALLWRHAGAGHSSAASGQRPP